MKNINHISLLLCFLFAVFLSVGLFFSQNVFAANVSGEAWSENIGWIRFAGNAQNGNPYGVDIDQASGVMSGDAWSENLGWISFNAADAVGCNGCSGAICGAKVGIVPVSGRYNLSGWARVLSVKDQPADISGGWDGCIYLGNTTKNPDGVYIDASGDFHGYAWSDMVLGWLSFNCANSGVCAVSNYKVHTTASLTPVPPEAKISCDMNCAGGKCNNGHDKWEAYPRPGDCPQCIFSVVNESTGSVQCSYWQLLIGGVEKYSYSALGKQDINLTSAFGNDIVPNDDYVLRLTVSDDASNSKCSAGNSSYEDHGIKIKKEVVADFVCSFDDPALATPTKPVVWQDCTSEVGQDVFAKKMALAKGGKVFVKDNNSSPSADGSAIDSVKWVVNSGTPLAITSGVANFTVGASNNIEFRADDNCHGSGCPRYNCKNVNFNARALPKWQEVNTVGMILKYIFATVSKIFVGI